MTREVKEAVTELIREGIDRAREKEELALCDLPPVYLEVPSEKQYGDLATSIALQLASQVKLSPRRVAEVIVKHIPQSSTVSQIEVAGPGFINFFLTPEALYPVLGDIEEEGANYGRSDSGKGKRVLIEFISANPTGPLTAAHGRHGAVGDALANILQMVGYRVYREYYYNDVGHQMDILGKSVQARYHQLRGEETTFPEDDYKGNYITHIAQEIARECEDVKKDLGFFRRFAEEKLFESIKKDLEDFAVQFDGWVKEKDLYESGQLKKTMERLKKEGHIYEKEGALWFRSSRFGDEKDRVVEKSDGQPTYLAPDIAYHQNKYERGFHCLIDILGPDHHGYVGRLKAAIEALGHEKESLRVIILQLVSLYRGKEKLPMSTRAGEFITLRQVLDEVGKDAARFFFLMRTTNSHLNFDLNLAKSQSTENPVYYVQYAHARICSILEFAAERGVEVNKVGEVDLSLLKEKEELEIIKTLAQFPEVVEGCARALEPHGLTSYLQELAGGLHNYYNKFRVIGEDRNLSSARLILVKAVRTTLQNGLHLLGISAPEKM
ncbi:arginine--tRNA ligase [candidate division NPL-UPA2 bacterium]|nr:arginine--tRNA ligase [candidate division NPL-UPA2 bacterium]